MEEMRDIKLCLYCKFISALLLIIKANQTLTTFFSLLLLVGRIVFTSFLKSEFSQENADFWIACEDYKKTPPSKLATKAKQIYQQYIEADAPNEVTTFFI